MTMKRAVVLLSGGIDSVTTLAVAKSEGYELYALSFDYGQRHWVELDCALKNAQAFGVRKHLVMHFSLRDIGGSALTGDNEVPRKSTEDRKHGKVKGHNQESHKAKEAPSSIPITYVPARNTIFLSFALAWAETLEAGDIFIGANAVDYSGYPDCRPEFIRAFEDMANLATKVSVEGKITFRIRAPLIALTKAGIIRKGTELGVDYGLTWSCYDPVSAHGSVRPCLQCDSCRIRGKGFKEAEIKDPLL